MEAKKETKTRSVPARVCLYLVGMVLIALGVNVAKMSNLGISPGSSAARSLEAVTRFTLGQTSVFVYLILVGITFLILGKKAHWTRILGVPISVLFGFIVDFTGIDPNAFGHILLNFPRPGSYPVRLLYLLVAIILIALGVRLYLGAHFVAMPVEGFAEALSIKTGKPFGDMKTIADCTMVTTAILIQLFCMGAKSFFGDMVVVREGTILSGILVGQFVKLFNKWFGKM